MSPFARDLALRARIDSLCLRLEERVLRDVADGGAWSFGRRVEYRAVAVVTDAASPAALAHDFDLSRSNELVQGHKADPTFRRLIAAWDLPGSSTSAARR
ncbi:MAG: hypothetical protein P4L84_33980 [Isosphaeraceae bacterium]|nr:hypothetical protein [Isosphaeraceae bacterium]